MSKLVLISISQDLAHTQNINIAAYNLIFMCCIAITIALGVRIVGGLMTAALVAVPACTARNISKTLQSYTILSLIAGAISCSIGIAGFFITGLSVAPLIIISNATLFLISLLFKR